MKTNHILKVIGTISLLVMVSVMVQAQSGRTLDYNRPVGYTEGSADVSGSGSATYSIPIYTPPGTAGMMPSVRLSYSSQMGTGLMGLGWSVSGMSSISRSGKNWYFDGSVTDISYTNADYFMLDGNRMVVTSGTNGGDASVYSTEQEMYARIISHGTAGNGPSYFEVRTKEGLILEYGNTTDSKVEAVSTGDFDPNGTIRTWYLNKVTDQNGNYYTYEYWEMDTMSVIKKINYTGNAGASLSPYNSIEFIYLNEERNNPARNIVYEGGAAISCNAMLDYVAINCEGTEIKRYEFTYEFSPELRLTDITEYGQDGGYYNSTHIEWGDEANFVGDAALPSITDEVYRATGDINQDGKTDLIIIETISQGWQWKVILGSNNGFTSPITGNGSDQIRGLCSGDYDSDGIEEVGFITSSSYPYSSLNIKWNQWNGTGFTYETATSVTTTEAIEVQLVDMTGDGVNEIIACNEDGDLLYSSYISIGSFPSGVLIGTKDFLFDFNGNRKTDLLVRSSNGSLIDVWEYNTNTSVFDQLLNDFPVAYNYEIQPGDFNGDGKSDLLIYDGFYTYYGYIYFSTGKEFVIDNDDNGSFINYLNSGGAGSDQYVLTILDFTGDGRSDILTLNTSAFTDYSGTTYTHIIRMSRFISHGRFDNGHFEANFDGSDRFEEGFETGWPASKVEFGDFNGDGYMDIVTADRVHYIYSGDRRNYVTKIYNGINNTVAWDYETLTRDAEYTNAAVSLPLVKFMAPLMVVKQMHVPDGVGGDMIISYEYLNGLIHRELGFIGFEKTRMIDAMNIQTESTVENIFVSSGGEKHFVQMGLSQQIENLTLEEVMSFTENENDYYLTNSNKSIYAYVSAQSNEDYLKGTVVIKTNTIDTQNGNITNDSISYYASGNSTAVSTQSTSRIYSTFGSWHVASRVESETVSNTRAGQEAFSRQVSYTYNTSGQMTQSVTDPSKSKSVTSQYQNFNSFGSPTSITVTATGITTRTSEITYDSKGRFILTEENALGQTASRTWDANWGKPLTETGVNGLQVAFEYDEFGRLSSFTDILDNETTYSYGWGNTGGPTNAVYYSNKVVPGQPDTKIWYDVHGREVRVQTDGFSEAVIADKEYLSTGQLYRVSKPRYVNETARWIVNDYDEYGRLVSQQEQDLDALTIEYNGLTVVETNPAGQTKTSTYDASGMLIEVEGDESDVVTYTYGSHNKPIEVSSAGSTITMSYDDYGMQDTLNDPDAGMTTYTYNALGQMISMADAKDESWTMEYNLLGQITEMEGSEGISVYIYKTSGAAINKLESVSIGSSGQERSITNSYNSNGFLASEELFIESESKTLTRSYTYDGYGRLDDLTYPGGFTIYHTYNSNGYMNYIYRSDDNVNYIWNALERNALNQPVINRWGNSIHESYTYDAYDNTTSIAYTYSESPTEMLSEGGTIESNGGNNNEPDAMALSGTQTLFQTNFAWNSNSGNMTWRENPLAGVEETFEYDDLNRLVSIEVDNGSLLSYTMSYATNGNIESKTDAGSVYNYDNLPHAVSSVEDNTGSISTATQTIEYTVFNKVSNVTENGKSLVFKYGPDRQRCYMKSYTGSTLTQTMYYFGNYEEKQNVKLYRYHYIYSPDGLVAIMRQQSTTKSMYWVAHDNLGSIMALFDQSRTKVQENSFDAWGRRRNPTNWSYNSVPATTIVTHGYTGHEHLDDFKLINMNGRVYDPVLGRFLSADPYVQDATNSQFFNRYSYCVGNPLKYVDPSGYLTWPWNKRKHKLHLVKRETNTEGPYTSITSMNFIDDSQTILLLLSMGLDQSSIEMTAPGGGPSTAGYAGSCGVYTPEGDGPKTIVFHHRRLVPRANTPDFAYVRNSGGIVRNSYLTQLREKAENYPWAASLYESIMKDSYIELSVVMNPTLLTQTDSRTDIMPLYSKAFKFSPVDPIWGGMNITASVNNKEFLNQNGYFNVNQYTHRIRPGNSISSTLSRVQPGFGNIWGAQQQVINFPGSVTLATFNFIPTYNYQMVIYLED